MISCLELSRQKASQCGLDCLADLRFVGWNKAGEQIEKVLRWAGPHGSSEGRECVPAQDPGDSKEEW